MLKSLRNHSVFLLDHFRTYEYEFGQGPQGQSEFRAVFKRILRGSNPPNCKVLPLPQRHNLIEKKSGDVTPDSNLFIGCACSVWLVVGREVEPQCFCSLSKDLTSHLLLAISLTNLESGVTSHFFFLLPRIPHMLSLIEKVNYKIYLSCNGNE